MKLSPAMTLRTRLLLLLLGPLTIVLLVSVAVDYETAFAPSHAVYDHALADNAMTVAARLVVRDERVELDLPRPAEAVLLADQVDKVFYAVLAPDGTRLAGNRDLPPEGDGDALVNPHFADGMLDGQAIRSATYRVPTAAGTVTVIVAETTHKREHTASRIAAGIFVPDLILILMTLAIVYVAVRAALKPLDRLGTEIAARSPHDLRPLPADHVPPEAQPLVGAINGLIGDLRAASVAQQAFLANAAHQMRTPLAGLQTQLELAAEEVPAANFQRIAQARDATRRLGRLTHQLLSLARSGAEADLVHEHQALDLADLLQEVAAQFFDAALERQIDLGFEPEAAPVSGSRWLLRELISNLIDNAIRYTPIGGRVTARCGRDEQGRAFVEVEDDGPGVPAAEQRLIFERFYRGQTAVGSVGTGLGLAIVREVADRHDAVLSLENGLNHRGTRFRVSFPRHEG
jgi:two-component system sensor histidine kinase TctE